MFLAPYHLCHVNAKKQTQKLEMKLGFLQVRTWETDW